ncbi:putative enzyme involved in biosynthesis of extracellular polysaccharides [Bernardetia litoralis DSM 6794]|uniref:Putative enzyme involved in biosynthesis of extracellular polysaccharides n=1 Tax=Bernardetia litoralis (strain ATCC 23117 / DSM 6794 / NBRC 15988 / NCIMB 1366 / Fx l1 / Sio-4) TaxID=880071 RepID=I4AQZ5_BERLS|nr:antibiotic biosynthesis monooxygenase [Bernardetia litoralis]AFM06380.1 putative enzyme involved in biosynthesis of extracellular polysaccharides [Bernardetia litoralis DSM 6794]
MIAQTLETPYYAVIFTSILNDKINKEEYAKTAFRMVELAEQQEGFLGIESTREDIGITVSYWKSLESIKKWKFQTEHTLAREKGRSEFYKAFKTRIAKVERDYDFFIKDIK